MRPLRIIGQFAKLRNSASRKINRLILAALPAHAAVVDQDGLIDVERHGELIESWPLWRRRPVVNAVLELSRERSHAAFLRRIEKARRDREYFLSGAWIPRCVARELIRNVYRQSVLFGPHGYFWHRPQPKGIPVPNLEV